MHLLHKRKIKIFYILKQNRCKGRNLLVSTKIIYGLLMNVKNDRLFLNSQNKYV